MPRVESLLSTKFATDDFQTKRTDIANGVPHFFVANWFGLKSISSGILQVIRLFLIEPKLLASSASRLREVDEALARSTG